MKTIRHISLSMLLLWVWQGAFAQAENPVIAAIQKEVERNRAELRMEGMASPFFITYSVVEKLDYTLSASLGALSSVSEYHVRRGLPMLLLGDYRRNNLNTQERSPSAAVTALYDNTSGIPITVWSDLDKAYKSAIERYKTKMALLQQQTETQEEEELPDFEAMQPVTMILQPASFHLNKTYWENYLRKASETAREYAGILASSVTLNAQNMMVYTYNTEGSRYAAPSTLYRLSFTANTRAGDGQELTHTIFVENATFEQMPNPAAFSAQCRTMMENLLKLREAPVIDDAYCGPVLFEGPAVVRIFRRALFDNNRLSASPQVVQPSGLRARSNDLELMFNKKVVSRALTIQSLTGEEFYGERRLNGYYPIDAEGVVPDRELTLIENGVLRNMLNGRKPTKKVRHSNGHARFDPNTNTVQTMPGNILIRCNLTFGDEALRQKLFAAAWEEDLEYAYIVRQYDSGINLIYKVYIADGREELVRGAAISDDASLKTFKRILGTSEREQIVTYGDPQATMIAPDAILFEEMDITRLSNIEFKKPYFVPKPE